MIIMLFNEQIHEVDEFNVLFNIIFIDLPFFISQKQIVMPFNKINSKTISVDNLLIIDPVFDSFIILLKDNVFFHN